MSFLTKKLKRSIRFPEGLYKHLEGLAAKSGRSVTQVVEFQLYTALLLTAETEADRKKIMALIPPEYGTSFDEVLKSVKISNPIGAYLNAQPSDATRINDDTGVGFFGTGVLHTLW